MIKYPWPSILCAVVTSFLWSATATPAQADTGTLRIVFGKVGLVAAAGKGAGILTFHGKHYAFVVAGASSGATPLGVSASVLRGTVLAASVSGPWFEREPRQRSDGLHHSQTQTNLPADGMR
jgi:hypothetical protein